MVSAPLVSLRFASFFNFRSADQKAGPKTVHSQEFCGTPASPPHLAFAIFAALARPTAIRACSFSAEDTPFFGKSVYCSDLLAWLQFYISPTLFSLRGICDTFTDRYHRQRTNCSDLRVLRHYRALRNFAADFQRSVEYAF